MKSGIPITVKAKVITSWSIATNIDLTKLNLNTFMTNKIHITLFRTKT